MQCNESLNEISGKKNMYMDMFY